MSPWILAVGYLVPMLLLLVIHTVYRRKGP